MKAILTATALALAATATATAADPSPQLVASVQARIEFYGFDVEVSQFATPTVAALHGALNQNEDWLAKRRRIKAILRNPVYK